MEPLLLGRESNRTPGLASSLCSKGGHMSRRGKTFFLLAVLVAWAVAGPAFAKQSSEQLVLSGTGTGVFTPPGGEPTQTPFGFWIWCEVESNNKYIGECHGAMYFYALGLTRAVEDAGENAISEGEEGIYTVNVISKKDEGDAIQCTLMNESFDHGPVNKIDVSCSAPAGSGQATGVVNVTGGH
jgi:hypothetical protein